jgi:hypothetical protein
MTPGSAQLAATALANVTWLRSGLGMNARVRGDGNDQRGEMGWSYGVEIWLSNSLCAMLPLARLAETVIQLCNRLGY